jgi:uncharacterized protein
MKKLFTKYLFLFYILCYEAYAQEYPFAPLKNKWVYDYAGILLSIEEQLLNKRLKSFHDTSNNELVIVTIPTLNGEPIEEFTNNLFNKWGIGSYKSNNGILILVAHKERKVRIEVGYGLEATLPDLLCYQIIASSISPSFKNFKYYEGLDNAITDIAQVIKGEFKPKIKKPDTISGYALAFIIFLIIFVLLPFINYKVVNSKVIDGRYINFLTAMRMLSVFGHRRGGFDSFTTGSGNFGGFSGGKSGGGGSSGSW